MKKYYNILIFVLVFVFVSASVYAEDVDEIATSSITDDTHIIFNDVPSLTELAKSNETGNRYREIEWHDDGQYILFAEDSGGYRYGLLNTDDYNIDERVTGTRTVSVASNDDYAFYSGDDGLIHVHEYPSFDKVTTIDFNTANTIVAVDANNNNLVASELEGDTYIYDISDINDITRTETIGLETTDVDISNDGTAFLAAGDSGFWAREYNISNGDLIESYGDWDSDPPAVKYSHDDQYVAVGGRTNNPYVKVFNRGNGTSLHQKSIGTRVDYIDFSEDGEWMAAGDRDGDLSVWDIDDNFELEERRQIYNGDRVYGVAFKKTGEVSNNVEVETLNPANISSEGAMLRGDLTTVEGGSGEAEVYFRYYDVESDSWLTTEIDSVTLSEEGEFNYTLDNIKDNKYVKYEAYAEHKDDSNVNDVGEEVEFWTDQKLNFEEYVYIGDDEGNITKFNHNLNKIWEREIFNNTRVMWIDSDQYNDVYAASNKAIVKFKGSTGNMEWTWNNSDVEQIESLAVNNDTLSVYTGGFNTSSEDYEIYEISQEGELEQSTNITNLPTIIKYYNNKIYVGADDVYKFYDDFEIDWHYETDNDYLIYNLLLYPGSSTVVFDGGYEHNNVTQIGMQSGDFYNSTDVYSGYGSSYRIDKLNNTMYVGFTNNSNINKYNYTDNYDFDFQYEIYTKQGNYTQPDTNNLNNIYSISTENKTIHKYLPEPDKNNKIMSKQNNINNDASYLHTANPTVDTDLIVDTLEPADITHNSAKLRGELKSFNNETKVYFEYEYDNEFYSTEIDAETLEDEGIFSYLAEELPRYTNISFRAVAEEDAVTSYGDYEEFTTEKCYDIDTESVDKITNSSARLNGYIECNSDYGVNNTVGFWIWEKGYEEETSELVSVDNFYDEDTNISLEVDGLERDTVYKYQAIILDGDFDGDEGDEREFEFLTKYSEDSYNFDTSDINEIMNKISTVVQNNIKNLFGLFLIGGIVLGVAQAGVTHPYVLIFSGIIGMVLALVLGLLGGKFIILTIVSILMLVVLYYILFKPNEDY